MSRTEVAAGGRLRDRVGTRTPATVFASLGAVLVAAGVAVPDYETLLVAWGGTALFLALLFRYVLTGPTVSAALTTDIYTTMASNVRRRAPTDRPRYVPDDGDGVSLVVGEETFVPIGERLLATVETLDSEATLDEYLVMLVDVVVNELELVGRATATVTEGEATVTATGNRVGTGELFDHPVVSLVGVALATHLGTSVRVETSVDADSLVVTCRWSQRPDELLDRPDADEDDEHDPADQ